MIDACKSTYNRVLKYHHSINDCIAVIDVRIPLSQYVRKKSTLKIDFQNKFGFCFLEFRIELDSTKSPRRHRQATLPDHHHCGG